MADDISILISGKLEEEKSKNNINGQIKVLQAKLDKVNLKVEIDDKIIKSLNSFSKSMEKFKFATDEANKVLHEQKTIIKQLDGSTKTLTMQRLKSGDIIQKERIYSDQAKQEAIKNNQKEQQSLEKVNVVLNERIRLVRRLDAEQNQISKATTYRQKPGHTTTVLESAGKTTGYKIVEDEQMLKKAEQALDSYKNKYLNYLKTLQQGKNAKFVDEHAVKYLQSYIKNITELDQKTKDYIQTQYNVIKNNAKTRSEKFNEDLNEELRGYKLLNQEAEKLKKNKQDIARRDFNYGNLIKGVDASTFGSGESFATYIKKQYGDSAELIGKFNDKQLRTGEIITQANFRVKEGSDKWRMYQATLNKTTGDMRLLDNGLKDVVNRQLSFNEAMKIAFTRITQWGVATSMIYGGLRELKEGLETLRQIDTELINIAKVTEYTKSQMQELTKTAIDAGVEYGRTAQEYLTAVTEFARAGMGKQSEEYAKLSLLLQNVGDVTAEVANETLIAANAGFRLGGDYEKLMDIIDKFNNVSNKNATNINKMSEAMKVGASVFHAAGMSIDETVAIIGTATAATQRGGSEISRAWRTILMNIRQTADEEAEVTEESMKKAESALHSVGIVVRDSPSTFRPMFEIIRDLGNEWDNLTQVQQAYIAEALAGKRQANVLISTLQNWDIAEKQLAESINAKGSALEENEFYMQSLDARIAQLDTSLTNFWNNLISTDSLKALVSAFTALIDIIDKLVNNSFSSFLIQTVAITSALVLLNLGLKALSTTTLATTAGVIALDVAQKGLIVTTRALTATMLASPLFWPVVAVAGIIGIIKAVKTLTTSFEEQSEKVADLNTKINSLQTEYDQLKNKDNRTEEEEKYLKLLEREIQNKKELHKLETDKLMNKEFFAVQNGEKGINAAKRQIEELKKLKEELNSEMEKDEWDKTQKNILTLEESLIKSQQSILNYKNTLGKVPPELQALADAIEETLNASKIQEQVFNVVNSIDLSGKTKEEISKLSDELTNLFQNINFDDFQWTKDFENSLVSIGIKGKDLEKVKDYFKEISNAAEDTVDSVGGLSASFKDLKQTIEESQAKYKLAEQALKEFKDTGKYNISTLLELAEKHENLLNVLGDEQAVRKELMNIISEEEEVQKRAYANMLMESETFYNARILGNAALVKELSEKYGIDFKNFKSLAEAKLEIESKLIKELSEMWSQYYNVSSKTFTTDFSEMQRLRNELWKTGQDTSEVDANLARIRELGVLHSQLSRDMENVAYKAAGVSFGGVNFSSPSSKSSSKKDKEYLEIIDLTEQAYKQYAHTVDSLKHKLDETDIIEEKIAIYNELIEVYKTHGEFVRKHWQSLNDEEWQIKQQLKGILSEENFNSLIQGDIGSISITDENVKKIIDNFVSISDARKKAEMDIKGLRDAVKDTTKEMADAVLKEMEKINNIKLDKIKEEQEKVIDSLKKKLDELNDKGLDLTGLEYDLKNITYELEKLEGKYDATSFDLNTRKLRNNLKDIKNDIYDIISDVEDFQNKSYNSKSNLESLIKREIGYANQLKSKLQEINEEIRKRELEYKRQEDLLKKQIEDTEKYYDAEIAKQREKLKLLDDEYQKEDRLKKLQDINDELAKVKADKRFSYITAEGEEVLTYNKDRVNELEKQRNEMVEQFEREDVKQAINDEIERLEKAKNDKLEIMRKELQNMQDHHRLQLEQMNLYRANLESLLSAINADVNKKIDELNELYNKDIENTQRHWDEMKTATEEGTIGMTELLNEWYAQTVNSANSFVSNIEDAMERAKDAWEKLKDFESRSASSSKSKSSSSGGRSSYSFSEGTTTIDFNTGKVDWIPKKHDGGFVGDKPPTGIMGIVNKLFNTKPNEQIIKALNEEFYAPKHNIINNFIPNMKNFASSIVSGKQSQQVSNHKHYHFNNLTIKANNITEMLDSLNFLVRSEG